MSISIIGAGAIGTALARLLGNRPPNPSPRFFQIAAWCAPIFGGHHFKPLSGGFRVSTAPYIPQGFQ
ncbi:MAG: hypothetical protein KKB56_17175, partial [Gammaproteobacteria bacterium]|nr:hypothetical protein [Gammaproteobacteria bacterium]